jgi:hypothetical protein
MKKLWIAASLTLAAMAPQVHAQGWGDGDGDGYGRWQWLRQACDNGDDRACWKLRQMRRRWREGEGGGGGGGWNGGGGGWNGGGGGWNGQPAPQVDPRVARCLPIQNNYNACVRAKKDCAAWIYELQANGCF